MPTWWGSERVAAAAVYVAALAIYLVRIPAIMRSTLFAEDGRTFLGDWISRTRDLATAGGSGLTVLFRPYAGYQHLVPRLISLVTRYLTPVAWWPAAMAVLSGLAAAATCALVYRLTRGIIALPVARYSLALIPVLTPLSGLEAIGDVANLHWYALYLLPWCLLGTPRTRGGAVGLGVVTAVATLTDIQAVMFAPVVAIRLTAQWRAADPRSGGLRRWWGTGSAAAAGWAVGAFGQVLTYLSTTSIRQHDFHDPISAVLGYAFNAGLSTLASGGLNRRIVAHLGWWPALAVVLAAFVVAAWTVRRGPAPARWVAAIAVPASVVSWTSAYLLNDHSAYVYQDMDPAAPGSLPLVRWGTAAAMLLAMTVPLAADALAARHPRWRRSGVAAVVVLLAVMVSSGVREVLTAEPSTPDWQVQLARARADCSAKGIAFDGISPIRTYPRSWIVMMPCRLVR